MKLVYQYQRSRLHDGFGRLAKKRKIKLSDLAIL